MTLEDFKRWKVTELKNFLKKRGIKSSGRKDELCALAFAARWENKTLVPTKADIYVSCAVDYTSLLQCGAVTIPDPLHDLTDGWKGEQVGLALWPPTMHIDIAQYLLSKFQGQDLTKRLLGDYKEGKAYSYFDCEWLKEVFYHPISVECNVCVLRSEATPSQRIGNIPHKVWVAIEKKSGLILSAYCTCFAG